LQSLFKGIFLGKIAKNREGGRREIKKESAEMVAIFSKTIPIAQFSLFLSPRDCVV
jgi:hypothetical protein